MFFLFKKCSSQRFLRDMMDAMKQSMTENKALRENERRLEQHIRSSGLQMRDEIPNDGNCLFHAIADQMERLGECSHDHTSLRTLAVETLKNGLHSVSSIISYGQSLSTGQKRCQGDIRELFPFHFSTRLRHYVTRTDQLKSPALK